jgi:hypothetical protein
MFYSLCEIRKQDWEMCGHSKGWKYILFPKSYIENDNTKL